MSFDLHFLTAVLTLGGVTGFTIYLGLPVALLQTSPKIRVFLNALSTGILLFLFVEIVAQVLEMVETAVETKAFGVGDSHDLFIFSTLFPVGFSVALLGLAEFEKHFLKDDMIPSAAGENRKRVAITIAVGIGLHNFSEGLVIGQEFAAGALALSLTLTLGFALHNATEGLGIAAPLAGRPVSKGLLLLLGLIGGGPTLLGTFLGTAWVSPELEIIFLSLAAGAIIYIVGELTHLGRLQGHPLALQGGLLVGFCLAFATDLGIEGATRLHLGREAQNHKIEVKAGEYYFEPSTLYLNAGEPTLITFKNEGHAIHDVEMIGLGTKIERVLDAGKNLTLLVQARRPGKYPLLCDRPGHLQAGMRGWVVVRPHHNS